MGEINYKKFIDNILKRKYKCTSYGGVQGIFDNFYLPFLSYMEEEFSKFLNTIEEQSDFEIDELVTDSFICSTKQSLIEVSLKTLITEFYAFKEKKFLKGLSSEEIYESYNSYLKDYANIHELLNQYEVLEYLIYLRLTEKFNLVSEAFTNLKKDIKLIREKFGRKFTIIESLTLNNGDTHNGGKSVMIFNFSDGEKLVYKPHGLSSDKALEKIYDFINSKNRLKKPLYNVKNINMDSYGWQDFAEYEPCEKYDDACDYYYRIGSVLAIFNILKTGDMHSENIIAGSGNPYLIDLETLLTNQNMEGMNDTLFLSYLIEISNSVLGCYILPQNLEYSLVDIDLSGLAGDSGEKSNKITCFMLKDTGTDKIRFEKEYVVSSENNNKPTLNGEKLNAVEFTEYIESGFEDTYSVIMDNKEEFLGVLCETLKGGVYRQVLRPTFIYARYLEASYHPKYLKKFEERERLFNILKECDLKTYNNNKMKMKKCAYECETLMKDDIPYFASDFESYTLYVNADKNMDNYFFTTLKDIVTERVMEIDTDSMQKQISYIRNSLLTTKKDIFEKSWDTSEKISVDSDDIDFTLRSIGNYIYSRAIFNTNNTACTYPNLNINGIKPMIGPINNTLYDGSGLILFLYSLAYTLNDDRYKHLAEASLKGMEEISLFNEDNLISPSVFSGIGSLVYLYYNLSVITKDEGLRNKYVKYLNKLNSCKIDNHDNIDVIGGDAGIIIALLNIYIAAKDKIAIDIAVKYADHLYKYLKQNQDNTFLAGFSHGYSGFALELIMAGSIMKNNKYYKMALDLVNKEDILYRESLRNWIDIRSGDKENAVNYWCHGAPGIVLARSLMLKYALDTDKKLIMSKIPDALNQFIENGFDRNEIGSSMCHGTFGNIDILEEISTQLGDSSLAAKKNELFKRSLDYIQQDGVKYGIYDTLGMMGFMTGISGIGYSILRQKNRNLPSILSLQVLKSEVADNEYKA